MKRFAAAVVVLAGLLASGAVSGAVAQAVSAGAASAASGPSQPPTPSSWLVTSSGGVFDQAGNPGQFGSAAGTHLNAPVVGMAATPDGGGYWLVAADGGVFTYGDAAFQGSAGSEHLNAPVVGMASTSDGGGYWLVAADGGVFTYGDAAFQGSAGSEHLNAPVVGMASTSDGGGYWLVASDGGVFSYGDAAFHGSAGGTHLNAPVVGMASTSDGGGYWLVAKDGGVFTYGTATFYGSMGGQPLAAPMVGMAATLDGGGYLLVAADGSLSSYGDGPGNSPPINQPVGGMAVIPSPAVGGPKLTLQIVNNSSQSTDMALYQRDPDLGVPDALSLGWMVHRAYPATTVTDTWSTDYSFTAATTGPLRPGAAFTPSTSFEVDPADPQRNSADFQDQGGALSFSPGQIPCQAGSLCLSEDSSVPFDSSASVGLAMSGSTAFATQAQPNFRLVLTPHPTYWVAAGTYQQGQVLDAESITNSAQISFPPGVTDMVATLNPDGTWSVAPGR